ncbi:MAG: hypothetical protein ACOC83_01415 [Gemmatimonadota bacterium]
MKRNRSSARVRRIGARSVFILFFVLYGFVGLVVGGLLFGASRLEFLPAVSMTPLDRLGAWSLLLFPAAYGLLGGFVGAVAAALYNFAATFTGGIRLDLTGMDLTGVEGTRGPDGGGAVDGREAPAGGAGDRDVAGERSDAESDEADGGG